MNWNERYSMNREEFERAMSYHPERDIDGNPTRDAWGNPLTIHPDGRICPYESFNRDPISQYYGVSGDEDFLDLIHCKYCDEEDLRDY